MSGRVYMRAEDNEAGVTVEDDRLVENGVNATVQMNEWQSSTLRMTDAEARAVVEGLLRRMFENDGPGRTQNWVESLAEKWRGTDGHKRWLAKDEGR